MLFADDLVILSDKAENLQTMVARVFGVLVKRKLEVNWKQSAIMMVARNRRDVSEWRIREGNEDRRLEEVNVYRYLKIKVAKNKIFGYQKQATQSALQWRVGRLKAKALEVTDKWGRLMFCG